MNIVEKVSSLLMQEFEKRCRPKKSEVLIRSRETLKSNPTEKSNDVQKDAIPEGLLTYFGGDKCFSYATYNAIFALLKKIDALYRNPPFSPKEIHDAVSASGKVTGGALNNAGCLEVAEIMNILLMEKLVMVRLIGVMKISDLESGLKNDSLALLYYDDMYHEVAVIDYNKKSDCVTIFDSLTGVTTEKTLELLKAEMRDANTDWLRFPCWLVQQKERPIQERNAGRVGQNLVKNHETSGAG